MEGVLIVDKPKGYTSHDIVSILRKELQIKKIGHTGTLDPNATGVLPILIGEATKISKYLVEHDKTYIATITLGQRTTTGDKEGEIIEEKEVKKIDEKEIIKVLKTFEGSQTQKPPIYSAIKINGKKAYEYARKGQTIDLSPREIFINSIELINKKENEITFKVECSKGTYIRILCEDIAQKLDTVGYMKDLRRIKVDKFNIEEAITIEGIKTNTEQVLKKIISIEEVFKEKSEIILRPKGLELFLNGVQLTYELPDDVYRIYFQNKFIGLGIVKNKLLKRDVIKI